MDERNPPERSPLPRFWIGMQVVIVICVAASIVIALIKL